MKQTVIVILWLGVFVTAIWLRFEHLGQRPVHADEATGARITARRMESGGGQFDPRHFHGPLLADLAIPLCRLRGESGWPELTKITLRLLPALAGSLVVLLPWWWCRRFGDGPMLLAAACLASSPLLVYYSRMFIHESLLVLFGIGVVVALVRSPRWGLPGFLLGLMFATKESFAISVIAWTGAGLLLAWENRCTLDRGWWRGVWRNYRWPLAVSLAVAVITAGGFYTDGFRHWHGAVDAVRTFFVYETVTGHDKSFGYYAKLLAIPKKAAGVWWFETPVLLLAIYAYAASFLRGAQGVPARAITRFLAYAAAGHWLIYSMIGYKTPWLACLPWAHVCLLAGIALAGFSGRRRLLQAVLAVVVAAGLGTQIYQARRATGRYASDARNPYAYVPTRNELETLEPWLARLRQAAPGGTLEPIGVIGSEYWPLPWYLRGFEKIGYWQQPPAALGQLAVVFVMPESSAVVMELLAHSHLAVPRGLRAEVPMEVFVRKDVWQSYMESDTR